MQDVRRTVSFRAGHDVSLFPNVQCQIDVTIYTERQLTYLDSVEGLCRLSRSLISTPALEEFGFDEVLCIL